VYELEGEHPMLFCPYHESVAIWVLTTERLDRFVAIAGLGRRENDDYYSYRSDDS
jgi:hypothetical protein